MQNFFFGGAPGVAWPVRLVVLLALLAGSPLAWSQTITSFAPASGPIGASVTITGSGFNATAAQNVVFFGATQAAVTAASPSSLTVTVPLGATYQCFTITNLATGLTAYSGKPFGVTLVGAASFQPKVDFGTGTLPSAVATGDLNGDGRADLVTTNYDDNTVSVLRNTSTAGTVSFAAKADFATSQGPVLVNIGDLDGDGKPDLAVTSYNSRSISVLRNTSAAGAVSFARVDVPLLIFIQSVVIGDVDGDGLPDLVGTNFDTNNVVVLRNTSTVGAVSFAAPVYFGAESGSHTVILGDVNGDGLPDLVVTNYTINTVSVFRNTSTPGTVSLAARINYGATFNPNSVALGDLDADGLPDLAIANSGGNTVSVLHNTSAVAGAVSFAPLVDYTVGNRPQGVAIGDVDGDGLPDLAVANPGSVHVLRNTSVPGTISLVTQAVVTAGAGASSVAIGDLDGDGKPDLVTANETANTVSVLRQQSRVTSLFLSQGTLSPAFATGTLAYTASVGNAVTSIMVGGSTDNPAATFTINGTAVANGTYSGPIALAVGSNTITVTLHGVSYTVTVTRAAAPTLISLSPTSGPVGTSVTLTGSDLTGAIEVDFTGAAGITTGLTVSGSGSNQTITVTVPAGAITGPVTVATPNGTTNGVTFTVTAPLAITAVSPVANTRNAVRTSPVQVTFNQSISAGSNAALKVFSAQRGGLRTLATPAVVSGSTLTYTPPAARPFMPGETVSSTVTTAATASGGGSLAAGKVVQFTAAAGVGPGTFGGGSDPVVGGNPYSVTVGDVDGDGDLDLLTANENDNTVSVRLNNGSGVFSSGSNPAVGSFPSSVAMGDVDNDGDLDLLTANFISNGTVSVRLNDGNGVFSGGSDLAVGSTPTKVVVGDVDGDGDLDLLTANLNSNTVSVRLNNGSGVFSGGSDPVVGNSPRSVAVGDVDGDGDLDLLTANYFNGSTVSVRLNDGSGVFSGGSDPTVGSLPTSVAVGDVDGDGDLDLLTANQNSNTISVRLNNGLGIFSGGSDPAVGNGPFGMAVGDVDGDGDLDLLAANYFGSGTVSVRFNNGNGVFGNGSDLAVGSQPYSVVVGDVDGDGDLDLLAANSNSNTVSVRINQNSLLILTTLNPTSGPIGTSVTITGTGLTGATSVSFNGTTQTIITNNTGTSLTVVVPTGATTGNVTVTTPSGTSNGVTFTVTYPDLVISTGTTAAPVAVTAGTYNSITVTGTGVGQLSGAVVVNTAVTVQGTLLTNCQPLTGTGSFTLAAGATLGICDVNGISTAPGSGAVQTTGMRSFSSDATYIYNGTQAQSTGNALPLSVRALTVANPTNVGLTQAVAVAQVLTLASTGNLLLNFNSLLLRSDATGTALVANTGGGVVLGNTATLQRHIETNTASGGYRHYASPMVATAGAETLATLATTGYAPDFSGAAAYNSSATPGLVTPFPTVFLYNQDRIAGTSSTYDPFSKGWQATLGSEVPQVGRGYSVQAPGAALVDFTGTLTSGNVSRANLQRASTDPNTGWHLLGNPFPSPLDWSTMSVGTTAADNLQHMDGALYVFQSSGPYTGSYRTYLTGAPGNTSPIVPAGSGFFVHTTSPATAGIVRFNANNRVTSFGAQPAFGRGSSTLPTIELSLMGATGSADALTLYANPAATPGLDAAYDAVKLANPSGLNLAALTAAGEALAIDGLPGFATALRVALRVAVPATGPYTLMAATLANLPATTAVTLTDVLTGRITDLRTTPAYAFTAVATAPATGRFFLNLTAAAPLATTAAGRTGFMLYPNPARTSVAVAGLPSGAALTVFDALGRTVARATADATGTARLALPAGLAAGVYIVRSGPQAQRLTVE